MNVYSIALFLHIVGALGFFVALGLDWMVLRQIRGASTAGQVREWMRISMSSRRLWISIQTRVTIALGIVYLMTVKPDLTGSLVTMGVAIALGLASALPISRRERMQEGPAD